MSTTNQTDSAQNQLHFEALSPENWDKFVELFGKRGAGGCAGITGYDLTGGDESGPHKPLGQGSRHFAGAEKTDSELR